MELDDPLEKVSRDIVAVEEKIIEAEREIKSASLSGGLLLQYWIEEERQLREKKRQLREEKNLLLLKHVGGRPALKISTAVISEVLSKFLTEGDARIRQIQNQIQHLQDVPNIGGKPRLLLSKLGRNFITRCMDLSALLDSKGPVVSLVATSGSGKTRTLFELLCLRFGFYFVADVKGNVGSTDLGELKDLSLGRLDYEDRRVSVQVVVKAALLARLFLLNRCLQVNFQPREWLLLQIIGKELGGVDLPAKLTKLLVQEVQSVDALRILDQLIYEQWELVQRQVAAVVIVLDEAQALFDVHKNQFMAEGGTGLRSSFHQVYEALSRPSTIIFSSCLIVSATGLSVQRETEGSSSSVAKQYSEGPAFYSLGKFESIDQMRRYVFDHVEEEEQVDNGLLLKFMGRYRPLARALEDYLEKRVSLNESLLYVRQLLTKEDVDGSYIRILKRIQVQPRIHDVELIGLCRMICLTTLFVKRYICTRKEEVEMIHYGLAYLDGVDVDRGEFGLSGKVEETLVLEALLEYFKNDNSILHIMNLLNPQAAGFAFEQAAASDICTLFSGDNFAHHPLFSGVALPAVFQQKIQLWSGDSVQLVCTKSMANYLGGEMGSSTMLSPEFLAGPDLVVPLKTENGGKLLMLVQFRLVNFLDKRKFEAGLATTDPWLLFRSKKALKLKREFKETVGDTWWENGIIRLMVVYPAIFKKARMPPPVEVLPPQNGVGPQLKIIIYAGNAKLLFSQQLINYLDLFKGFQVGEPERVATTVQDKLLALELHNVLNGRPPRKRDYESTLVAEEDEWGDDAGMDLDI